jgi:hypothetical protein
MAKEFYRVDGRCSVSHQTNNFVALFCTFSLCLCRSLGLSCVVQCNIALQLYVGGWCYCNSESGDRELVAGSACATPRNKMYPHLRSIGLVQSCRW